MKAILLISHGSRSSQTKIEVLELVKQLKELNAADIIEFAFLELENPSIPDGIKICIDKGATQITVLLNFLNSGRHVDVDIPLIVQQARLKFPGISILISKPIGQHPGIVNLFLDLLN